MVIVFYKFLSDRGTIKWGFVDDFDVLGEEEEDCDPPDRLQVVQGVVEPRPDRRA